MRFVLVCVFLLIATLARADVEVTGSGTLAANGERYYLTQDQNITLVVSCTGCTLDLQGFVLNPANTDQITLNVTGTTVTIEDGTIKGEVREAGQGSTWRDLLIEDPNNTDSALRLEGASDNAVFVRVGIRKTTGSTRTIEMRNGSATARFENCLILGSTSAATVYIAAGATGHEIIGCSVDAAGGVGRGVDSDQTGAETLTIYNTIMVAASGTRAFEGNGGWTGLTHANNCYVSGATAVIYDGVSYGAGTITTFEPTAVGSDPLWVNNDHTLGGNYALGDGSPCIGAGNPAWANEATDYDGNDRTIGTIDIGALERDAAADPTGACCANDDSCSVLTEAACAAAGGTYQGDATDCDPDPCIQLTGACCVASVCSITTEANCSGSYRGDGTDCDPDPCVGCVLPDGYILIDETSDLPLTAGGNNVKYVVSGRVNFTGASTQAACITMSNRTGVEIIGCVGASTDTLYISGNYWAAIRAINSTVTVRDLTIIAVDDGSPKAISGEQNSRVSLYDIVADGIVEVTATSSGVIGSLYAEDSSFQCSDNWVATPLTAAGYWSGSGIAGNDTRKCGDEGGEWIPVTLYRCVVTNDGFPAEDNESLFEFVCADTYAEDCVFRSTAVEVPNNNNPCKQQAGRAHYVRCEFRSTNNGQQWSLMRGFTDPGLSGLAEHADKLVLDECFLWCNSMGIGVEVDTLIVRRSALYSMGDGSGIQSTEFPLRSSEYGSYHLVESSILWADGNAYAWDAGAGGWPYPVGDNDSSSDEDYISRYLLGSTVVSSGSNAALKAGSDSDVPQTREFRIKNSIIRSASGEAIIAEDGFAFVDSSNVWWSGGPVTFDWENAPQTWAQWQALGLGVNGVNADPLLTSPDADTTSVFILGEESPAIGLADPQWWILLVDYASEDRSQTSGAYESGDAATGACCDVAGTCSVLTEAACLAGGSGWTYQGDGTVCTPNPCPTNLGACCIVDAWLCVVETQAVCLARPGSRSWQAGIDCAPDPCPDRGQCCFDTGSCSVSIEPNCLANGGTWTPAQDCTPNPCPQPGACCFVDGTVCDVLQEEACTAAGGTYQGDDTACQPDTCPILGACCTITGTCSVTLAGDCVGETDTWVTAVDCDPNPCSIGGACCDVATGACVLLLLEDCTALGDVWQGEGTDCSPNPCTVPTGACCVADTLCYELLTEAVCETDSLGTWFVGATCEEIGTDCQPVGACCIDGVCSSLVTRTACDAAGGDFYLGQSCGEVTCAQPTGACCVASVCSITTGAGCAGTYQGDGTDCDPDPCPQPEGSGACCEGAGVCVVTTDLLCSGDYQGDDTDCTPNPCPQPLGGCCDLVTGDCNLLSQSECAEDSGYWTGGSDCGEVACPELVGACCLLETPSRCVITVESVCDAYDGVFQGGQSDCDPDPCTGYFLITGATVTDEASTTFLWSLFPNIKQYADTLVDCRIVSGDKRYAVARFDLPQTIEASAILECTVDYVLATRGSGSPLGPSDMETYRLARTPVIAEADWLVWATGQSWTTSGAGNVPDDLTLPRLSTIPVQDLAPGDTMRVVSGERGLHLANTYLVPDGTVSLISKPEAGALEIYGGASTRPPILTMVYVDYDGRRRRIQILARGEQR